MTLDIRPTDALIAVDIENDFLPGGALAVRDGNAVINPTNRLMPLFPVVVATRDWHPGDHCSFAPQGGPWPVHCVAETEGAAFPATLAQSEIDLEILKAQTTAQDAYSGFDGTDLAAQLRERGVERVFVTGLATDYCVRATTLDALHAGFAAVVVTDAVRAVDVQPGDGERALAELQAAGATLITSDELRAAAGA